MRTLICCLPRLMTLFSICMHAWLTSLRSVMLACGGFAAEERELSCVGALVVSARVCYCSLLFSFLLRSCSFFVCVFVLCCVCSLSAFALSVGRSASRKRSVVHPVDKRSVATVRKGSKKRKGRKQARNGKGRRGKGKKGRGREETKEGKAGGETRNTHACSLEAHAVIVHSPAQTAAATQIACTITQCPPPCPGDCQHHLASLLELRR